MNTVKWLVVLVGVALFGYAVYDSICLYWGNPDATDRRLWIDHTNRRLAQTACVLLGFLGMSVGFVPTKK